MARMGSRHWVDADVRETTTTTAYRILCAVGAALIGLACHHHLLVTPHGTAASVMTPHDSYIACNLELKIAR
jgi:hypothetical protein